MSSRKELNQDKILTHLESGMIVELPFADDRPLALFLTRCANAVSIIIFQCSISWICWSPRIMDGICNTRTAEENTRLSNYTGECLPLSSCFQLGFVQSVNSRLNSGHFHLILTAIRFLFGRSAIAGVKEEK